MARRMMKYGRARFQIDRGVGIPPKWRPKSVHPLLKALAALEVGDSFRVPDDAALRNAASRYAKRIGISVATRTTEDGARVWRTA